MVAAAAGGLMAALGPVGAVAAGVGAVVSLVAGSKSRKAAKKAARIRAQMVTMKNARERRDVIRDFRQQRAQAMVQNSGTMGIGLGSSGVQGQISSLGAQTGGALKFIDKSQQLNTAATKQEIRSSDYAGYANTATAIGGVAHSFANATGGYDKLAKKFGWSVDTA